MTTIAQLVAKYGPKPIPHALRTANVTSCHHCAQAVHRRYYRTLHLWVVECGCGQVRANGTAKR